MEHVLGVLHTERPKGKAKGEPSPLEDCDNLKEEVKLSLHFLNENFFTKEWKKKGLDTGRGHKLFAEALQTAIGSKSLGNISIFKEGNV